MDDVAISVFNACVYCVIGFEENVLTNFVFAEEWKGEGKRMIDFGAVL